MTVYLSPEQVLFLHSRIIDETGGVHGLRDLGLLQSALDRPRTTYDNLELYPELFSKAAALMESLVRNHPFLDGNKRTAIAANGIFLALNHHHLQVSHQEMVAFTLSCARSELSLPEIADWFKYHSG